MYPDPVLATTFPPFKYYNQYNKYYVHTVVIDIRRILILSLAAVLSGIN